MFSFQIFTFQFFMFIISTIGMWELIRSIFDIEESFIPGITVAAQVTVLFFAGLFNLLPEAVTFLSVLGFLGMTLTLVSKDKRNLLIKRYCDWSYLFLCVTVLIVAAAVHGKCFSLYDNFSHWALVVRQMLQTDRFPTFMDPIIEFQDYPLGSASFIYFFCKSVGKETESIQMLAQAYMMIVSMLPLFSFSSKKTFIQTILILATTNFFFVFCVPVTELLVDTLLAVVSAAGMSYALRYRKATETRQIIPIALYLIQILQIKNSGMFFALAISAAVLAGWRENTALRIGCILSSFFTVLLWHKHAAYVFADAAHAQHSISSENYQSIIGKKTMEDIRFIIHADVHRALTIRPVIMTVLLICAVGLIVFLYDKGQFRRYIKISIAAVGLYILYQTGTLAMYLFSMPISEARSLASFDRYTSSILIFVIYMILAEALTIFSDSERGNMWNVIFSLSFVLLLCFSMRCSLGSVRTVFSGISGPKKQERLQVRLWVEDVKREYDIPLKETYTILVPAHDLKGYAFRVGKFVFQTDDVTSIENADADSLDSIKSKYVLIYDQENDAVKSWVNEKYPEQAGEDVIILKKD